ncbi:MAG: diphthine--ammonia ligase [bacterium]
MKKVIVSWSGGKDSCLACYKAIKMGYNVSYLLNTISNEYKRVRFHGTKDTIIQKQAHAIDIPLLQIETNADSYEKEFKEAVRSVLSEGIEGMVFGDIFLHMREFADKICNELGIQSIEPLCGYNPEEILQDFIDLGFKSVIVATQANLLGKGWLGRKLDKSFLKYIKRLKSVDVCGENGEFHSLVIDGPIFKQRINITKSHKILREGYRFLDIQGYQLIPKNEGVVIN